MLVRLSKLMSERGLCSRREADRYIEAGQVLVDGQVVSELGTRVAPDAQITLAKQAQTQQKSKVTIILNKPIGFVSTQPEDDYIAAIQLVTAENHWGGGRFNPKMTRTLSVAGRLDIDSKGLLVLTQDGTVVKKLIGPDSGMEKEYLVGVEGNVSQSVLAKLRYGLSLDGKALKRADVELLEPGLLRFVLREGKKRQIRRMCELVHLRVVKLKRVRVGKISLGNLPEGKWRYLDPGEQF
jgi:23S rRNA pseudouridine2604 synthase